MMHALKETLLAHLDGELSRAESQEVTEHLGRCGECAAQAVRFRETADIFSAALRTIDRSEPRSWQMGSTSADGAEEHVIPLRPPSDPAASRWWSDGALLRRAAAILLFTTAAASAAVLGGRALLGDADPAATLTITPAPAPPAVATVAVPPENGRVHITLNAAGAGTRILAVLTAAAEATVAIEGATPHVTAAGSHITVELDGAAAVVRIGLPATLLQAEVIADGAPVIRVRNGTVTPSEALTGGVVIGSRPLSDP